MNLIYLLFRFLNANSWLRFVYGDCSFLFLHCKEIIPKIRNKYSHKENSADSFPISKFMFQWAIYIFPRSVRLFCCRKIGGPIVGIYTLNRSRILECGLGCAVSLGEFINRISLLFFFKYIIALFPVLVVWSLRSPDVSMDTHRATRMEVYLSSLNNG